jgi:hypothetical protein
MEHERNRLLLGLGVATALVPTTLLFLQVNLLFFVPLVVGALVFCLGLRKTGHSLLVPPAIVLAACAWVGPFFLAAYWNREGNPVEILVPVGFQGKIEIIRDRKNGHDLKHVGRTFVFAIPPSGVLRVKETYPFHRWHSESCVDTVGHSRYLEGKGSSLPGDGTTGDDGTIYRWEVR